MTTDAMTPDSVVPVPVPAPADGLPVVVPVAGPTGGEERAHDNLAREIDALSLRQALLDFEMANARVLDLTARLVEANARVVRLQKELDAFSGVADLRLSEAAAEIEALRESVRAIDAAKVTAEAAATRDRAELVAIRSSRTFRAARLVKRVVGRISR